jgi:predicted AlkP superfamily phosphohydrolase/phosphomutase
MGSVARGSGGGGRRRAAVAAATVVVLAGLAASGFYRVPGPEEALVVSEWLGGIAPEQQEPGVSWRLPLLVRIARYPAAPYEALLEYGRAEGRSIVSRDGAPLRASARLRLRPDPDGAVALHRAVGSGFQSTEALSASLIDAFLGSTRAIAYDDLLALGEEAAGEVEIALRAGARDIGLGLEGIDEIRFWPEVYPEGYDPAAAAGPRILLVGLDGADWKLLDPLFERDLMPNLERLVREGARARLRTIAPVLSPIIWTSAATGKRPEKHGIVDFLAVDSRTGRQMPVTSTMRTARAFWEILSARGISVGTVAWWATWPAEPVLGFQVSDRVAYQLFGQSESGEGLRGRTYPEGLILSLAPLVAAAGDRAREDILEILGGPASEENQDEQGLLQILTSTRIYHHAALSLIREYAPRVAAVYYEGTDTVAHHFMRYAPPRMRGVTPEEVDRWGDVVERYYVFQDRLLGELLGAVGEGTTVIIVSDHGFMTGATRPQTDPRIGVGAASDWHRKWGVLVVAGPGIPVGETLPDLSVLDVTPTILALLGLPAAEDMDGRVVEELLGKGRGAAPPPIATYEGEERWKPPTEPSTAGFDPVAARVGGEMIAKLTALGSRGATGRRRRRSAGPHLWTRASSPRASTWAAPGWRRVRWIGRSRSSLRLAWRIPGFPTWTT